MKTSLEKSLVLIFTLYFVISPYMTDKRIIPSVEKTKDEVKLLQEILYITDTLHDGQGDPSI